RPALGQRAREMRRGVERTPEGDTTDTATGRAATTLLPNFDTITYRELRDRVAALSRVWQSHLVGGFPPGGFVAMLGFTSIDSATIYLTCIRMGAVFVPLPISAAAQLTRIVTETAPRIFAASLESLNVAVDVLIDTPSVERLVVFDYISDDGK